jgi:hypothetical protein
MQSVPSGFSRNNLLCNVLIKISNSAIFRSFDRLEHISLIKIINKYNKFFYFNFLKTFITLLYDFISLDILSKF